MNGSGPEAASDMSRYYDNLYRYEGVPYLKNVIPPGVIPKVELFDFLPDDVIVATYPKCGTVWMQEIVDVILNPERLDTQGTATHLERAPFVEIRIDEKNYDGMRTLVAMDTPRLARTHLRPGHLKSGLAHSKFIVVFRNTRDMLVSLFHFYTSANTGFQGNFQDFFELYSKKDLCYGDYHEWVLDWLKEKGNKNVTFVKFESMKENVEKTIRHICAFLGKTHTDDVIRKIADHVSFESMRTNVMKDTESTLGTIFRKGSVGDWVSYMTDEQAAVVEAQAKELLGGTLFE